MTGCTACKRWFFNNFGFPYLNKTSIQLSKLTSHKFSTYSFSFSNRFSFCQMLYMWIRREERRALKVIQCRLFPDKVLSSIPVKPELQSGTGSYFQGSGIKAGVRCNALSTLWFPAATFMAAFFKRFLIY